MLSLVQVPVPTRRVPEIIPPLHVGDIRLLEFVSGTRGIFKVAAVRKEALGLGYSFESVSSGNRVFVYDADITRDPNGCLIVTA